MCNTEFLTNFNSKKDTYLQNFYESQKRIQLRNHLEAKRRQALQTNHDLQLQNDMQARQQRQFELNRTQAPAMPEKLFDSFEKAHEELKAQENQKQKHEEIKATFEELTDGCPTRPSPRRTRRLWRPLARRPSCSRRLATSSSASWTRRR